MLIKKFLIVLSTMVLLAFIGYQMNKNKPNDWVHRYDLTINPTSKIYLVSLNNNLQELKVADTSHLSFYDFVIKTIREQELDLRNKYPEFRGIMIQENKLSFNTDSLENTDDTVEQLIKDLNIKLNKEVKNRLETFLYDAKRILEEKRKIEIQNLEDAVKFYNKKRDNIYNLLGQIEKKKDTKIKKYIKDAVDQYRTKKNNLEDLLENIDKYLEYEDQEGRDIISFNTLQKRLTVLERYSSFNKLELSLQQKERQDIYTDLNLIKVEMIKENFENVDILILRGLGKRFNKKPTVAYSIYSFGIIGFFLGLILLFLILNARALKRLMLKMLSTLPSLK